MSENMANIPQGSTPERHALETARIAEVFGLTGGELADDVWTETAVTESGETYEVRSHWWYDGVPEYAESDHPDWPTRDHRTMVRDIMFGEPPARLGDWEKVAVYRSSGEVECRHKDAGIADADCQLCEGDGFVYIGDGWAEIVYRRVEDDPAKPCKACAAIGRFTWLNSDGTCRREDVHR